MKSLITYFFIIASFFGLQSFVYAGTGKTVNQGTQVTLNYASANVSSCTGGGIRAPLGYANMPVSPGGSGSQTFTAQSTGGTFVLECTGNGQTVSDSAVLTVLTPAVGSFDAVDAPTCRVAGWAYDPKSSATPIDVHIYKDGANGVGTQVTTCTANTSRPDVNTAYGITGNHGFDCTLPASYAGTGAHNLYIHAIDTGGAGPNNVISNSPKSLTCVQSCTAVSQTWSTNCSANLPVTTSGSSVTATYSGVNTTGANPQSLAVGDIDGDGKTDLVTANLDANTISVFRGIGNGAFSPKVDYPTGSGPRSVAMWEITGDSYPDLVVANFNDNTVSVFKNNGNGTFGAKTDYSTGAGSNPYFVRVRELGTGGADIVTANYGNNKISVFMNTGGGNFGAKTDYTAGTNPVAVTFEDVDRDGDADVAIANFGSSNVSIFKNNGSGILTLNATYATGISPSNIAFGKLTGDTYQDMLVTNFSSDSNSISVFWGDASGNFTPSGTYPTGQNPASMDVGDLNGDGFTDVAVANLGYTSYSILTANGTGGLNPRVDYPTSAKPRSIALKDLTGDGQLDLVMASTPSNLVSVFINTGSGVFAPKVEYQGSATYSCSGTAFNAPTSVSCALVPKPDLIAGSISPVTTAMGSSTIFSASITNNGNASTGMSSDNFIQVASSANGGGTITNLASSTMATLGAGSSAITSQSYTFASAGTFSMRACADKSTPNDVGAIMESDETNNCGAWTNITVIAPPVISATCQVGTNVITVTGTTYPSLSGATYPLRFNNQTTNAVFQAVDAGGACLAGNNNGDFCVNAVNSLPSGVTGNLGTYDVWAHTLYNGVWSPAHHVSVTCSALSLPDLIAGGITPTSAIAGTAQSYTSTITNSGSAASGAGFTVRFRRATDVLGTGATNVGTGSVGSSVASGGGTAVATLSNYNISSSAGTYYLSACADETNGGDGVINESTDGNNCGPWTAITVTAPSANCPAQAVTWGTGGACSGTTALINHSSTGSVTDSTAPSTGSATYACTNGTLSLQSGSTCTVVTAPTVTLSASPTSITSGNSSTLTWTVSGGATSCSINQSIGTVATTGGTQSVSPTSNTTYTITCSNTGGSASASATVTVGAGAWPDLVAGDITQTSATVGVAVTLSATILNQGNASTANGYGGFMNFIQIATGAGGTGTLTDKTAVGLTDLAAGAQGITQQSHTFLSAGTYYARACADKTNRLSTPPGAINENTNEGNNCGNWIPITVTAPTANCPAQSVTWGTRCSATTANINHGSTGFVEDLLSPDTGSATYACNNGTLTLQSGSICVFTPTVTLTASPASITSGNSSTLTWTASNAVSCSINQSIGSVSATGGTRSVSPTTTTTYTLTCNNGGEVATASATVTVQAGVADLVAQTINPITATVGVPFTPVSSMSNQGTSPASIPFPNYYQIKAGTGGTGSVVYTSPSTNMNYLAAGLSGGISLTSYTFSSVGTYSIMVCTDKASPADTGVITESNEGNNCSNWATITVVPPLPDLQTFGIDLVGDTLGQPTTFTFSIYNTGPLDTGVGFSALLQFSADYGTTWQDASVANVPAISQGGSEEFLTLSYTFPSTDFYLLRVCADMANGTDPGSIVELSETNNCSGMAWWQVYTVPSPDLIVSKVTPTNAIAGVVGVFSATVTNQGDAGTGASFPYFFQVASQAGGAGTVTDKAPYSTMNTIVVGSSRVATVSHTFASSGTYSMRVCADKQNSGHAGNITESDENNNCGLWEDISVVANCPAQAVTWGTGGACSSTTALINHSSTGSVTDSATPNTGSATFLCTNGTLSLQSGSTCTLPPTVTLSASPTSIVSGNSSTLTWTVSGSSVTSCTMTQDVGTNIGTVSKTGGTRSVSPTATTNYTITCTNAGGSASANIVVTVTAPTAPDLTASKVTPTNATAGTAKTFSATITNSGDATTGASFPYFFQVASQAGGAGTITGTTPYSTMNTLTVGASAVATVSHTFASSGTYSMRVCADKQNNGHAGNITESDENNNCGLWENISVVGDCPAGQTITWGTGNACTATTGFIGHGSTGAINDSTLPGIGSATMSCSNGTLTIQPGATCAVPPTVSLTANPNSIASGGTSNLSWTVSDADTCSIDQGIGNVSAITGTHSLPVTPTVTTTYTLTCSNTGGASTASAVVSVTPTPNLVISVQVGPQDAYAETASTFTATIANVGNAGTGVSFPYFFQVASQAGGAGTVADLPSSTMGALGAGGQGIASVTHTFNSYGTYSMRACADKVDRNTTTSNDSVNESNEGDNCGEWKDIAVPQPTGTLSVDSPTCLVLTGQNSCSIRVSWVTQYAQNPIVRNESTTPVSILSSGVQNDPVGILTPIFVDEIQPTTTTLSLKQGSILLDEKTVTARCEIGGYDTIGRTCVNPRVTLLTVHGEYYAPQGSLTITCSDSDKYKVTRRLANGTEVSVGSGSYSGSPVSVPVSITGDYSVYCGKGSYYQDPPVVQRYNASPPPSPNIVLTATPSTLTRDSDSHVYWTITHPRPGCTLKAETVCQNNTCNQNQIDHQTRMNQTIENALVNSASNNMLIPYSTITMSNLPYVKNSFYFNSTSWAARASWVEADWSVSANKAFVDFAYSTNFTLTCPRTQNDDGSWSATSTKSVRVMVTSSGER